jgi:hypothetical protein
MIFLGEPNMFVRPTGVLKNRVRPFRFDANGEYETDNPLLIKVMSAKFPIKKETKQAKEVNKEVDVQAIRQKAKEMGIKNWHNKKIDNLIAEMGEQ